MRYRFPYVGADLRLTSLQSDTSQLCETTDTASVSRDVPVSPQLSPVDYSSRLPMVRAELTCAAGSAPRWFSRPKTVTHPGTNPAWRRVTTLTETNALPISRRLKLIYSMIISFVLREQLEA